VPNCRNRISKDLFLACADLLQRDFLANEAFFFLMFALRNDLCIKNIYPKAFSDGLATQIGAILNYGDSHP
jgi:hypothetical protein